MGYMYGHVGYIGVWVIGECKCEYELWEYEL